MSAPLGARMVARTNRAALEEAYERLGSGNKGLFLAALASYSPPERSSCLLTLATARTARIHVPRRQSLPGRGDRSNPTRATSMRRSDAAGTSGR